MKRIVMIPLLIFSILFSLLSPVGATGIQVRIDAENVVFTQDSGQPFIDSNSRTLVPLRAVMEQYGCQVDWDRTTQTAFVFDEDTRVSVPIGKKQIRINNTVIATDTAAQIKENRTYLPIRAVLEAFGASVDWSGGTQTVLVKHPENAGLRVHFLDVGQADCILLTSNGENMLIDAGNNADADLVLTYLLTHGITELKYAMGTHPHEDHIGSLDDVLYAVPTDVLLMPDIAANSVTYRDVVGAANACGLDITSPRAGTRFSLGKSILTCVSNYSGTDLNNVSLMCLLTYGETSFLFTGDAEAEAEAAAMQTGINLDCDVLKVGHHGSRTSSSDSFLRETTPEYAVISCGQGNSYGHPHAETLNSFAGTDLYRTDAQGTITVTSDGTNLVWNTSPSVSASVPEVSNPVQTIYILNTNTKKFHLPHCSSAAKISSQNRSETNKSRAQLLAEGYSACKNCNP